MRIGFLPKDMQDCDAEVIVVCSTYNHEGYIRDALEGFISQRTTFSYIVLVHDDSSTDETASIVRHYASLYPEIIKGVFETDNQYSQGLFFWYNDYLRASSAKYVALCEGDDYWINPEKLQMQYEALESTSLGFCFTNAIKIDAQNGAILGKMLPNSAFEKKLLCCSKSLDVNDVLSIEFIPTASFFARIDAWLKRPELPEKAFKGDRAHQMFLTYFQGAYYLDLVTTAYRVNNPNSMMASWMKDVESQVKAIESYILLYEFFDSFTQRQFSKKVQVLIDDKTLSLAFAKHDRTIMSLGAALIASSRRGVQYMAATFLLYISPRIFGIAWKRWRQCH